MICLCLPALSSGFLSWQRFDRGKYYWAAQFFLPLRRSWIPSCPASPHSLWELHTSSIWLKWSCVSKILSLRFWVTFDHKRHFLQDLEDRSEAAAVLFYTLEVCKGPGKAPLPFWCGVPDLRLLRSPLMRSPEASELWVNCLCISETKGVSFSCRVFTAWS